MARHCMRPGCDRPAAARLTYDTEAAAVWLDPPIEDGQPAQQVCGIHAGTLTAPLGWTVTDRRMVGVGDHAEPACAPVVDRDVSPVVETVLAASDQAPEQSAPERPKADTGSRGKLLERAFEWTGPQHSVLTTGHGHRRNRRD